MSLKTHISGVEDRLIDGLHFAGRPTSSYITERRNCTFSAQSGALFTPNGIRLMRFNLSDQQGWLDGQTLRLVFDLQNKSSDSSLQPICASPASMFQRLRVIASGSQVIEDVDNYGRVHEMFSQLLPSDRRYNDVVEGWGATSQGNPLNLAVRPDSIAAGKTRR